MGYATREKQEEVKITVNNYEQATLERACFSYVNL